MNNPQPNPNTASHRLEFIDGLRGFSAILVVLFHVFYWNNRILMFDTSLSEFWLFRSGWLGAELFFVISGFVILISLERCANFKTFFVKRLLRIYPALLIAILFLLVSYMLFSEGRYFANYTFLDFISSLTLTDPNIWNLFLSKTDIGISVVGLNASFWTLFIELKFYILFGGTYYLIGHRKAVYLLILWSLVSLYVSPSMFPPGAIRTLMGLTSGLFFSWFSIGVTLYLYYKDKDKTMLLLALTMAFVAISHLSRIRGNVLLTDYYLSSLLVASFFVPLLAPKTRWVLSLRPIQFLGSISYPLYLIHEPFLIPAIYTISLLFPVDFKPVIAVVLILFTMLFAHLVSAYWEPFIFKYLKILAKKYWNI